MSGSLEPSGGGALAPPSPGGASPASGGASNLADVLERVLDKGIVIVGDIRVNLLDIELLTIKLRLVVAGVDTARRMGIDWWERDPWLSGREPEGDHRSLQARVQRLERQLEAERSAALEPERSAAPEPERSPSASEGGDG